jgi:S-adenosylmethionine synthetase
VHVEDLPYELVERKGLGHPDTMCDAIGERASQYYARHCLETFGAVAHHWFDKVLLFGGEADFDFGRGDLVRPYTVLVAGKAARTCGGIPIPVTDLLRAAASDVLTSVTTGFDPSRHLVLEDRVVNHQGPGRTLQRYRPRGPQDLVALGGPGLTSNDTNLLHGFAPLSRLEQAVLGLERELTGARFKAENPDTGWDIKVFGSRLSERFSVVVNMPFIAARVPDHTTYVRRVAECTALVHEFVRPVVGEGAQVVLNPADRGQRVYLTALGSVADTGDVGAVGRGNRTNGLITPMRPMSIEAAAGKNPLDHTGKLYSVLARDLAAEVAELTGRAVETHVFTSKEAPVDLPDEVVVRIHGWHDNLDERAAVQNRVEAAFLDISSLTRRFIDDGVVMW